MEIKPYLADQQWDELKLKYNKQSLFEDTHFKANASSLYTDKPLSNIDSSKIEWKRPQEFLLSANLKPQFVVDDYSRFDLSQGNIGDCWFISGCVGVLQEQNCFNIVVPEGQDYDDNYCGMFHFRFWMCGDWVDVVIDDRLPCIDNKLVFCSNHQQINEMWAPLLEKAYAKFYGSYEAIVGGDISNAFIDMDGGIEEAYFLREYKDSTDKKDALWRIIYKNDQLNSLMGCKINYDPSGGDAVQKNGLVKNHAYAITKTLEFKIEENTIRIIRLRNPYGNNVEWSGPWSDGSKEWNQVPDSIKKEIGLVKAPDGESWMSFEDFVVNFDKLEICHSDICSLKEELIEKYDLVKQKLSWSCEVFKSEWQKDLCCGCCEPTESLFWNNPQYLFKLQTSESNNRKTPVYIALMQHESNSCLERKLQYIQYYIYKVKDGIQIDYSKPVKFDENQLESIDNSGELVRKTQIHKEFYLENGCYIIIPAAFQIDVNYGFLLRIFIKNLVSAQ